MHCEGCARIIEALVARVPGVQRVAVSFDAREAQVELAAGAANDAGVVAAIEQAGFRAKAAAR